MLLWSCLVNSVTILNYFHEHPPPPHPIHAFFISFLYRVKPEPLTVKLFIVNQFPFKNIHFIAEVMDLISNRKETDDLNNNNLTGIECGCLKINMTISCQSTADMSRSFKTEHQLYYLLCYIKLVLLIRLPLLLFISRQRREEF